MEEVDELGRLGLLGVVSSSETIVRAGGTFGSSPSIWGAPKASWRLTEPGRLLAEVTRLNEVDAGELATVQAALLS